MNVSIIRYILGHIIELEGFFMLLPCTIALVFHEKELFTYLAMSVVCILLGSLLTFKKAKDTVFYLKEGCIATVLSWVVLSFFGALPFVITGEIPHFTDAMFETVSGFTTTGASILNDIEALSHTSLFWRSFTHWIGGMGVLVFLLAIVPLSGGSNMNLMRAESPGPSVGKLVPKMRYTARILYIIYFVLTALEFIALLFTKMPVFDSICISIGTAGTGGFGILNSSCAAYSTSAQWIISIFMILFSINFYAFYLILFGQIRNAFKMEEIRVFLTIVFVAIALITWDVSKLFDSLFEALTHATFQVASIISSTGFATTDFDTWPGFSKTILVILMFIGACAGSTGGGIKVSRFVIMGKSIRKELHSYIHPKSVKQLVMDGKEVEAGVIRSVGIYLITFLAILVLSTLIIALEEKDLITNVTSVLATLNNIGPGLSMVGPTQNFAHFTDLSKWVFIFDMLAGRLELFPLLLMFHPTIWHELLVKPIRKKIRQTNL
jgi:trk system potassium uptake protein TrkH